MVVYFPFYIYAALVGIYIFIVPHIFAIEFPDPMQKEDDFIDWKTENYYGPIVVYILLFIIYLLRDYLSGAVSTVFDIGNIAFFVINFGFIAINSTYTLSIFTSMRRIRQMQKQNQVVMFRFLLSLAISFYAIFLLVKYGELSANNEFRNALLPIISISSVAINATLAASAIVIRHQIKKSAQGVKNHA